MKLRSVNMGSRVLVVDDQAEVRLLFATALRIEGFDVYEAANAATALHALREQRFSLVLTDYAMPGGTGTDMIRTAEAEGLLGKTPVVVITAHPDLRELDGFRVWHKPLDVERFIEQIKELVEDGGAHCAAGASDGAIVELVLYVTANSIASHHARQGLELVLKLFDPRRVRATIVDPSRDLVSAERDCVTLTPVLVRRSPRPKVWLLGDLREPELLIDLITASGGGSSA